MRCRSSPLAVAAFALAASIPAFAQVTPTAPGPGDSYRVGADCIAEWDPDSTGTWTSFDIDLMSGSNTAMTVVTRVADSMDGTSDVTTFTFECPDVTPNSAIYFLQFSQDGLDPQWTTRFTIASATGAASRARRALASACFILLTLALHRQTTTPTESTQADGDAIPWGSGELADGTVASTVSGAVSVTSTSSSSSSSSTSRMVTSTSSSSSASKTSSRSSASKTSSGTKSSATAAQASTNKMFYDSWPLGGKIGLLVGVIVAGLVLIAIFVFFCIRLIRRGKSDRRMKKSGAMALSSPSQAALTKSTDDDGLDFKDEQDSNYKPSNESMADLHAAGGRGPYPTPGQAVTHNHSPAYNDDGKLRRESVWVAPEENRAGMGVGQGRGATPWRRPSPDLAGGFQAPAFDARYAPQSQPRGATGAEVYPLIPASAGRRPLSATEVDGYTPTGSGTHEGGYQGGYQWSTQVRDTQQAESDWIQAHQAKR